MWPEVRIGDGSDVDDGVILGYPSGRMAVSALVIGAQAYLRSGTVIYAGSEIGDRFETGHHVVVREQSRIGDDVSVWSNTVVDYGCVIGSRVKIHSNCYLAQYTLIEDDVFIAPGVSLANDLFPGHPESARLMAGPLIHAGAQIGVNATVLPYVTIGAGALIGAGAVVTKDVAPGTVAFGNPARPAGRVEDLGPVAERLQERQRSPHVHPSFLHPGTVR